MVTDVQGEGAGWGGRDIYLACAPMQTITKNAFTAQADSVPASSPGSGRWQRPVLVPVPCPCRASGGAPGFPPRTRFRKGADPAGLVPAVVPREGTGRAGSERRPAWANIVAAAAVTCQAELSAR